MHSRLYRFIRTQLLVVAVASFTFCIPGCSTTPKAEDRSTVIADSRTATEWFTSKVPGLQAQIDNSAGYIIYPGIGQYGILIGGGKFGRGVVYDNNNMQIGWAYINSASAGLQVGAQGYKMLVVFENSATMKRFQKNKLTGNVGGTLVAANSGTAGTASFTEGVAVYQGGQSGLMAGASVGLDYMRYERTSE